MQMGKPQLEELARGLAKRHTVSPPFRRGSPLLAHLHEQEALLDAVYQYFRTATRTQPTVSYAAEWLLDNFYVIQQTIRQIREDLPPGYYHRLPKLLNWPIKDCPRVYALAWTIVQNEECRLELESIIHFVQSYQEVSPLLAGEVWALPTMLRLGILESLAQAVARITDLPFHGLSTIPVSHQEEKSAHDGLSPDADTKPSWQVADETVVSNCILSLRMLAAQDWKDFFERVSWIERELRRDPVEVYARMDFETRDRYRKVVEELARATELAEVEVVGAAIKLAQARMTPAQTTRLATQNIDPTAHVGYYLVGEGRASLETRLDYSPTFGQRVYRWVYSHPTPVYLSSLTLFTLLFVLIPLWYAYTVRSTYITLISVGLLVLIPASAVAIGLVNCFFSQVLPPRQLPRLDFQANIPADCRTMVVIPALLSNTPEIRSLLQQLELHYLGNPNQHLYFALLTDFTDASQKNMPADTGLVTQAQAGIQALNQKFGIATRGPFLFFHRDRTWNAGENCWMGWERKRGKLVEFNRLLSGDQNTTYNVQMGDLSLLPEIKYIITLDADTSLPPGSASRLIATFAHPLNKAQFDADNGAVTGGYTVLQPRVQVQPTSANHSLFTQVYAGDSGWDLYTRAVSDVYQDLFGEGNYVGKGIYDVEAFKRSLSDRVPANSLLSHDLFEGLHGRAGLVTDIILFEDYPPHYLAYAQRLHRWVRGDWQISPWLLPRVPHTGEGHVSNNLSRLDRWKIFDNLRRSLLIPALLLLFTAGWLWLPGSAWFWTLAGLFTLTSSFIFVDMSRWIRRLRDRSRTAFLHQRVEVFRSLLALIFLPYESIIHIDAIITTLIRLFITRKRLLQWTTAAHTVRLFGKEMKLALAWKQMLGAPIFAAGLFLLVVWRNPPALLAAIPFLLLWIASPQIACWIDRPVATKAPTLTTQQYLQLRCLARLTWLFFEHFVGPDDHWLPPDHFQEDPRGVIAHRTSPTNIGLLLLSTLAACDLGYIGAYDLTLRLDDIFEGMGALERYRGHFLNWYDTSNLDPLPPRYISVVDSGNLAGCLLVLKQGCTDVTCRPVLGWERWQGLLDTLGMLLDLVDNAHLRNEAEPLRQHLSIVQKQVHAVQEKPDQWAPMLARLCDQDRCELDQLLIALIEAAPNLDATTLHSLHISAERVRHHLLNMQRDLDLLLPWLSALDQAPGLFSQPETPPIITAAWQNLLEALPPTPQLAEVPEVCSAGEICLAQLLELLTHDEDPQVTAALEWCTYLTEKLRSAGLTAGGLLVVFQDLSAQAEDYFREMNFGFLYDTHRQVFHIGYSAETGTLDNNHYDLLASEARLASLLAIAKGDVPQAHWLHLARPLTQVEGIRALLSWSGTMFEYLMPTLFMRNYPNTLIDQSCRAAVDHQISYGRRRGIPWGISESSFYHFDANLNYQYQAFGAPRLGFKRGLAEDLVVSPYASLLAISLHPRAVMRNIAHLIELEMLGLYGFYEAVDFTPARLPAGQDQAIVHTYMAHHQGMILLALSNYLQGEKMIQRFHADPRVQSVELYLQEQVPVQPPLEYAQLGEVPISLPIEPHLKLEPWYPRVEAPTPQAHCLSNGRYSLLVTSAGSGYSSWQEVALTRWRADTTLDDWGLWIYILDQNSGEIWSASYQPTATQPESQEVLFYPHKTEHQRYDHNISLRMEITVPPGDDVEIRRLILTNHGDDSRQLRLTSYGEVVLAPLPADRRHPAFMKLFVESEYLSEDNALMFYRRPRSIEEKSAYLAHLLVVEGNLTPTRAYEVDRDQFLGRGGNIHAPAALTSAGRNRSVSSGATLDPIMSLSQNIKLAPHATVQLAYITMAARTRQKVISLIQRYQDWSWIERAYDQARTRIEREMNQAGLTTHDIEHFQQLLSVLLYPHPALRAKPATLAANVLGQAGLWPYTISGDYPILLVRVNQEAETALVQELLRAHTYWRKRQIRIDLVILNLGDTGYDQDLQVRLQRLISRMGSDIWLHQRGGIFLLRADRMSESDRVLLQTVARVILDGGEDRLAQQLENLWVPPVRLPQFVPTRPVTAHCESTLPLERPTDLRFDNGLGGFSADGREYVIYLNSGQWTPSPWINVVANPHFGFLVSEGGLGFTWAENSGENRLTPWHNDPVSNIPGEALYVRDEDTGQVWSPTPSPIQSQEPYLIRHGTGYSIFEHHSHGLKQWLRIFAAPDAPVKVLQLRLENTWSRTRRLTTTYYAEWVLGTTRDDMAQYILPEFDSKGHALLARNPYHPEFGSRVAFLAASRELNGMTADRAEFLGRMGNYQHPAALNRVGLTAQVEAGSDPCAAIQSLLWLAPGETKEITFLLGQGANQEETIRLIQQYQDITQVEAAWQAVHEFWDGLLNTVKVETPDPAMNLLLNRWLLYQVLSCRMWGRSALYQSSGAYGFRDQLQDVMALVHAAPNITREHILRAAGYQFEEGDVLHWWHPPAGRGVRTSCSDDLLWLPFVTTHYVTVTGDVSILDEKIPFLEGAPLSEGEKERYGQYETSVWVASLFEHCRRALESGTTSGSHGLPLIGSHDWNDGMNRVGIKGQGESVWLGWFLHATLTWFAALCELRGDEEQAGYYRRRAEVLSWSLEANAWDGAWYRRAYYDDGSPMGSAQNRECQIDSIAQSWAVLSGAADLDRAIRAMESVYERLVLPADRLVLLFAPPFDKTRRDPGYIKGYLPGIRENGGQYTHAALWTAWAIAELGQGDRASELFNLLNPIYHSDTAEKVILYRVEPYVVAADVYSVLPFKGRGGWTWYTGSASWMYRLGIEAILGLRRQGTSFNLNPCVPKNWSGYELNYQVGDTHYNIQVDNTAGVNRGVRQVTLDGEMLTNGEIPLLGDGQKHKVWVQMG